MTDPIRFQTQWTGSERVQHHNDQPEVTKQSHRDSTDINLIIAQYDRTGILVHLNKAEAQYADVSEMGDYQDALDTVRNAEQAFMELSSAQRKIFNNSAAQFLDAAHDPDKRELLEQAGLIPPAPTPPAPIDVNVITPPEAPASPVS
jgi:hypothetical protein